MTLTRTNTGAGIGEPVPSQPKTTSAPSQLSAILGLTEEKARVDSVREQKTVIEHSE